VQAKSVGSPPDSCIEGCADISRVQVIFYPARGNDAYRRCRKAAL
jgi:hypothetical protein